MATIRRETALLLAGDSLLLVGSLWLALTLRELSAPSGAYFLRHFIAFLPLFGISFVVFFIAGLYEKQTRLVRRIMGGRVLGAQVANTVIAALTFFFLPFTIAPKTVLALYLVSSVVTISLWRFYAVPRFAVKNRQQAVLVGTGKAVEDVHEEVNHNGRYRLWFKHWVDTGKCSPEEVAAAIVSAIAEGARLVVIDTRDARVEDRLSGLYASMVEGVSFLEFSTFFEGLFDRVPLDHVDYAWLLECLPREHAVYDLAKRAFDLVMGLVASVVALPFLLVTYIVLTLSGGTPLVFFERIGRGNQLFRIVKFRTMLFNDGGDPELQKKNQVTRVGRWLRRSRIDELPQLLNILKGELSFIGPRPELPAIASVYEKEVPYYAIRHLITPGLSGWAQLRDYDAPRGAADVERTHRKLSYDLYYLKNRSFGLDLVIALKTMRALLAFSGR